MLNNPFVIETAKAFAARLAKDAEMEGAKVESAFPLAYGRAPSNTEARVFTAFLQEKGMPEEATENRLSRLERFALVIFATNEFMYVD